MKVVYMGKDKPAVIEGLKYLIQKGAIVAAVVGPSGDRAFLGQERLVDTARSFGIPVATDTELYEALERKADAPQRGFSLEDIDLVISFLFWKRIRRPLIDLPRLGCINFHPAPLPEFRGLGGYNLAIYENLPFWGVSAHFVDESFDTGDVIRVQRFSIEPSKETALSLEQKSQCLLLNLFREVIDMASDTGSLPRSPQGEGRYISREDFERLRRIQPSDTLEAIDRKIRAFWFPPYQGASIEIQGREFTLVNKEILEQIGRKYHG